jgi:hypothetical protein
MRRGESRNGWQEKLEGTNTNSRDHQLKSQQNAAVNNGRGCPLDYMVVLDFFFFFFFSVVVFVSCLAGAAKEIVPRANARPTVAIMSFFI